MAKLCEAAEGHVMLRCLSARQVRLRPQDKEMTEVYAVDHSCLQFVLVNAVQELHDSQAQAAAQVGEVTEVLQFCSQQVDSMRQQIDHMHARHLDQAEDLQALAYMNKSTQDVLEERISGGSPDLSSALSPGVGVPRGGAGLPARQPALRFALGAKEEELCGCAEHPSSCLMGLLCPCWVFGLTQRRAAVTSNVALPCLLYIVPCLVALLLLLPRHVTEDMSGVTWDDQVAWLGGDSDGTQRHGDVPSGNGAALHTPSNASSFVPGPGWLQPRGPGLCVDSRGGAQPLGPVDSESASSGSLASKKASCERLLDRWNSTCRWVPKAGACVVQLYDHAGYFTLLRTVIVSNAYPARQTFTLTSHGERISAMRLNENCAGVVAWELTDGCGRGEASDGAANASASLGGAGADNLAPDGSHFNGSVSRLPRHLENKLCKITVHAKELQRPSGPEPSPRAPPPFTCGVHELSLAGQCNGMSRAPRPLLV